MGCIPKDIADNVENTLKSIGITDNIEDYKKLFFDVYDMLSTINDPKIAPKYIVGHTLFLIKEYMTTSKSWQYVYHYNNKTIIFKIIQERLLSYQVVDESKSECNKRYFMDDLIDKLNLMKLNPKASTIEYLSLHRDKFSDSDKLKLDKLLEQTKQEY